MLKAARLRIPGNGCESDSIRFVLKNFKPRFDSLQILSSLTSRSPPKIRPVSKWIVELGKAVCILMAKKERARPEMLSVYLYIPNIVGYLRVLLNCVAFAVCFSNKTLFSVLYFFSFCCDAVDGWCARRFNQVSTFGAVLDMVTDRVSTACLLVILSQIYRPSLVFLSLLALDIASHWLQMYSTFLAGKSSHKDVKDSTSWLFKLYYGNRIFMCYCCVSCEVLYIILLLIAKNHTENLLNVVLATLTQFSPLSFLLALTLFGWSIKQTINVIQMKTAADVCVLYDIEKQQKP